MKFSVFTPTHNTYKLRRAYESLLAQTYSDWEWIIVPNGEVTLEGILSALGLETKPDNIKIVPLQSKSIGALKQFACKQAAGDYLVELDHDDELTPDCLEELNKTFTTDSNLDFAYSDTGEIREDGSPNLYNPRLGFERYTQMINGRVITAMKAFPPSPVSFSRVWYGPNHVRAWKRSFYEKIGGHDANRAVLDDHDLVARTYINGRVAHIPKCLYVYHWTEKNTSQEALVNPDIQQETLNIHDKYIFQMIDKWAQLEGFPLVDLCAGDDTLTRWHPVDLKTGVDLDKHPWPFADNSIGAFRAFDALEHLKSPLETMKEIYRCLIPGGWLLSLTPSTDGRGAFQDPTHVSYWNSNAFWYYTRREQAQFIGTPVRFQKIYLKNYFPTDFHKEHNILYVRADLIAVKDEAHRPPGPIEI